MMSNQNEFVASIKGDGTVNIQMEKSDGSKSNKVISLSSFSQLMKPNDNEIELPLLPKGIRKYKQHGDNLVVAIEHSGIVTDVRYNRSGYSNVPTPQNSIWITLLRANTGGVDTYTIVKTNIYALSMPLLSESQELYRWPFPNHSVRYGLCWGNDESYSQMRTKAKIVNLSSFHNMYFSAEFNDDLGFNLDLGESSGGNYFGYLSGKETFDNSWLVREGSGSRTFNDAVERLLRGRD